MSTSPTHTWLTNGGHRRPIRIAGASGGVFDRFRAIEDFSNDPEIDVIFGDWMSEISMTMRGAQKLEAQAAGTESSAYETSFLLALAPGIKNIARNKQKVAVNAGACDAATMAKAAQKLCQEHGTDLKVSYVLGDDVTDQFRELLANGEEFPSLPSDTPIKDWGHEPICAQAYLGGVGIAEALRAGADIVICGRVADASPVIGAAMWWHNWSRTDFGSLANALIAGHLIECSSYVTGGAYSGFKKELLQQNNFTNMGFPIAEIGPRGEVVITKEKKSGGIVTVSTCTAQLVYEIQGPLYYNCDVTADIEEVYFVQEGPDRVRVCGVRGYPPPPTTKIGITARGGYKAEFHFWLTGLDIKEKVEMVERQTIESMGEYRKEFTVLTFTPIGSVGADPTNQNAATVDLRIAAQTKNPDLVSAGKTKGITPDQPTFAKWCIENCLQGYVGGTPAMDLRPAVGTPFYEYFVALFPQGRITHEVHHCFDAPPISISPPQTTMTYPRQQKSYETEGVFKPDHWGPTKKASLGLVVHGRSGDKSSDANVGFFVRDDNEWDWLRSTLTTEKIKELLGEDYRGGKIDRFELRGVRAVHFLLRDHLDRGVNSCSSIDILGKNVGEYLRYKQVEIPVKFLEKGTI